MAESRLLFGSGLLSPPQPIFLAGDLSKWIGDCVREDVKEDFFLNRKSKARNGRPVYDLSLRPAMRLLVIDSPARSKSETLETRELSGGDAKEACGAVAWLLVLAEGIRSDEGECGSYQAQLGDKERD
ncbi:hypothetical protein ARMGADRAFT_1024408 [Armillaria gallica]|uniref:Uncharacterized protein n=1 Tax=Armillaria gallica TaxID=47427 RepID=A0A2H3EH87_ARMGA|nr:hypothetical protein ARMGADRAFT_1024408 [Armillaria gallica]